MSQALPTWDLCLSSAPQLSAQEPPAADGYHLYFYKQDATLLLDGSSIAITPGSVALVPPGVAHQHARHEHELLCVCFELSGRGETASVAAVQDLGPEFSPLAERFEHALRIRCRAPARAEARLWDILWELSERTARQAQRQNRRHAALDRACRVIQSRLSEQLCLADLATPAGVSPAHLTRLFRAELGVTATDFLRRSRLERALHLLTRSELAIKEIACEVGIPDLHAFNKAIRRGYGVSPRELRARGAAPSALMLRTTPPEPASHAENAAPSACSA